jgi:hypothetical protein
MSGYCRWCGLVPEVRRQYTMGEVRDQHRIRALDLARHCQPIHKVSVVASYWSKLGRSWH